MIRKAPSRRPCHPRQEFSHELGSGVTKQGMEGLIRSLTAHTEEKMRYHELSQVEMWELEPSLRRQASSTLFKHLTRH